VEKAGAAVAAVIAAGIIPRPGDDGRPATRAVEEFVHAGYDLNAAALLLAESDGTPEEVEEEIARMIEVLRGAGAYEFRCRGRGRAAEVLVRRKAAFGRWAASRRTTTVWTARYRASAWPRSCASSRRWRRSTRCAAPTCSTPATATCTR